MKARGASCSGETLNDLYREGQYVYKSSVAMGDMANCAQVSIATHAEHGCDSPLHKKLVMIPFETVSMHFPQRYYNLYNHRQEPDPLNGA